MTLTLDETELDRLFPAYLCLDLHGTIASAGPSLQKLNDGDFVGRDFFDVLQLERPNDVTDIEALRRTQAPLILQACGNGTLRLRGIVVEKPDCLYLLLGHIPEVDPTLQKTPLSFSDFSPTDGSLDILLAAEVRKALLDDAHALAVELREEKRAAEAANVAKSSFLAAMSHEIRTPMNGVLGMASVLSQTGLEASQRDMLDIITQSGQSLLTILNDILDLSKIESGKLEIERTSFCLDEIVRSCEALFGMKAEEKGLAFDIQVREGAHGTYHGDPTRIRQILNNLVSNAIKFTDKGGVDIRVRRTDTREPGVVRLEFEVEDTGIGMHSETTERLFSPFTQADSSTNRQFGGTGLGLAISKRLCRLMDGWIQATSEFGTGSMFSFFVQVAVNDEASLPKPEATPFNHQSTEPVSRGLRILAAEDNKTNRILLRAFLEPLDADLTMVKNGREAVDAWRIRDFDIALMDIQMPVMDGIAAVKEIRGCESRERLVRIPIIAVSANAMTHQVCEYLEAGMDAHIAKPIDQAELLQLIGLMTQSPPGHTEAGVGNARAW